MLEFSVTSRFCRLAFVLVCIIKALRRVSVSSRLSGWIGFMVFFCFSRFCSSFR